MARLPTVSRESVPQDQLAAFDELVSQRGGSIPQIGPVASPDRETNLARSPNYKYWVFGAVGIGVFASVVDHGSVNVALPTISSKFQTDLPTIQWVVIIFSLTIAALLLPMGRRWSGRR